MIKTPREVNEIIAALTAQGYEAFAVGGCVRDSLLGREPGDWDITTSARPEQLKGIFKRTIDTGILHGTVTVMKNHVGYEVTTYRIDGEYEDGRHPKSVEFTSSLKEDLRRRDFTINAMAYSQETGIIDEFGGMEDLRAGLIRCVGNPMDRFEEDALRILRAIRFSAQLGFSIEENTRGAIRAIAPNLEKVSKERIQAELTKLLLSGHPEKIQEVYELGISPYVSKWFHRVCREHMALSFRLPRKQYIRWGIFLKDTAEEDVVRILKDLRMDNDTIFGVRLLNQWIYREIPLDKPGIRRAMSQMEPEYFDDLLILKGHLGWQPAAEARALTEEIRRDGDCISLKMLAVSGRDLLEAGLAPGQAVGKGLAELLDYVLDHPEENKRETLLRRITSRQLTEGHGMI